MERRNRNRLALPSSSGQRMNTIPVLPLADLARRYVGKLSGQTGSKEIAPQPQCL